jgi:Protein of unknown function (DUF2442)
MDWNVEKVEIDSLDDYRIRVFFKDGLSGLVEFRLSFFKGVFSHLVDPKAFAKVTVFDEVVTWPGHLDLAPDAMYDGIKNNGGLWVVGE